jgi:hypothetical protein
MAVNLICGLKDPVPHSRQASHFFSESQHDRGTLPSAKIGGRWLSPPSTIRFHNRFPKKPIVFIEEV